MSNSHDLRSMNDRIMMSKAQLETPETAPGPPTSSQDITPASTGGPSSIEPDSHQDENFEAPVQSHPADHHPDETPAIPASEPWSKPTLAAVVSTNRKDVAFLFALVLLFGGMLSGWIVFIVLKTKGLSQNDGGSQIALIVDAAFILLLLIDIVLILRKLFYLRQYFQPPRDTASAIPGWLLPRLPSYVDAVGRGEATGDVEDRWIVGENLPKYGDNRGSTLLLRSLSRGGAPNPADRERHGSELAQQPDSAP